MSTQPAITSFFGNRKRRAADIIHRDAKLFKADPGLLKCEEKIATDDFPLPTLLPTKADVSQIKVSTPVPAMRTPRKKSCDIRSYMTSQASYRPECPKAVTPVKFIQTTPVARIGESTPVKAALVSEQIHSSVKKSIRFDDPAETQRIVKPTVIEQPTTYDTDDIIKAANDLVEKLKNQNRSLGSNIKKSKQDVMTAGDLKKKLARSAKLAELKSSLNKLGKHASELIKIQKKKQVSEEPKLTKFSSIEIEVQKSPHKGALASPVKSPMKPAYERFAHLITPTSGPAAVLPLPLGYQRLLDLFISTDTVCSIMFNRGESITFRKLKPSVQELSRRNFTERLLGQMATVLPSAFTFRQEKMRNFGSTSKADRYELVVMPIFKALSSSSGGKLKITPKMLQERRDAFQRVLLSRTMDKHDEFLRSLEPPITVERPKLTRWHPNFPLDMVPDVPPQLLPEAPDMEKPTSAKDVLERAKTLLSSNDRMLKALDSVARATKTDNEIGQKLDQDVRESVDKRIEKLNPLKGISKSLLDKIRAKQAAKALEVMKVTPEDEKELLMLSQLPDTARIVRTLFIDGQKSVLPLEIVVEKIQFSSKRSLNKGDVESLVRRLVTAMSEWLTIFSVRGEEFVKMNRSTPFAPLMTKLDNLVSEKRRAIT